MLVAADKRSFGGSFIFLLAMITALDAMAIDMYLPAFPAVAQQLAVSPGQVQQTLSVFLVGLALGQALYGPLLDRFGRRMPLLIGLLVFVAGSAMAAMASSLERPAWWRRAPSSPMSIRCRSRPGCFQC